MRWKPSTRFSDGRRGVAREVLESWGIDNTRFVVADGSGLSRYNYVTALTQPLAFAVLANNFPGPARPILAVIDRLVDQLASSTRSDRGHPEPCGRRHETP